MQQKALMLWRSGLLLRLALISLILFATSACKTASTVPLVIDDYCKIAKPITFDSKADTPATVAEIKAHSSRWVCVCQGDCPKP